MLKIRRPLGRLIFNMGIAIPGKTVFLIETAPCWGLVQYEDAILQYRKSQCGDKMIFWPSYLHNGISYMVRLHLYIESGPRVTCPIDCLIMAPCCPCSHFPPLLIVALLGSAQQQISQCGHKHGSLLTSQIVLVYQWVKIHGNHHFATEILLNLLKLSSGYWDDGWVQLWAID